MNCNYDFQLTYRSLFLIAALLTTDEGAEGEGQTPDGRGQERERGRSDRARETERVMDVREAMEY